MSDEVSRLAKICDYTRSQWKELTDLCADNPPPYISIHIPFELLRRVNKLEKSTRIANKLVEILAKRVYITTDISIDKKEGMLKNLERMREEIVQQQWAIFDIEMSLRGKKGID